ncbi:MAG: hypothetical protein ACYTA3_04330 [Planctomycetota bacterium]
MKEKIATLIERFPNHEKIIKALGGSNARFQDLLRDHHDVHRRLASAETYGDPARKADLESRYRNLEEELIRLIQGYPMA